MITYKTSDLEIMPTLVLFNTEQTRMKKYIFRITFKQLKCLLVYLRHGYVTVLDCYLDCEYKIPRITCPMPAELVASVLFGELFLMFH